MPKFTMLTMGLDPHINPQAAYLTRLFGVRDMALGVGVLSTRGDARKTWWRIGMMCDLGDALAGVVSARGGQLPDRPRLLAPALVAAGIAGAALGAGALLSDDV
jgi:hypothetical protein